MTRKPKLLYLAAGAAVIGIGLFAAAGDANARPRGGKHLHFQHFHHRFHAERHIYVVPVIRPRVARTVKNTNAVARVQWAKKCGGFPEEA